MCGVGTSGASPPMAIAPVLNYCYLNDDDKKSDRVKKRHRAPCEMKVQT